MLKDKLMSITVKGNQKTWSFNFYADPKYLKEWRKDGLEIDEIVNTIPEFITNIGLTKVWVFFQDILNFKNPWK